MGASGSFALAWMVLAGSGPEAREFARRSAPRFNRLCLGCACVIALTGLANLAFVARKSANSITQEFASIVAVKLVLFAVMAWMLWLIIEKGNTLRARSINVETEVDATISNLARLYGATLALGAIALLLGLWLAGL